MSSSASSTENRPTEPRSRHSRGERVVARLLVAALVSTHPLSAAAGDEFTDANSATFDPGQVSLDNSQAGRTTFTIGVDRTTIGWQELHQPGNNRLEFDFTNGGGRGSSVLNYSNSVNAIRLSGQVVSNGTVAFANPYGVYIDGSAVIDVGNLVAIGANVSREAFLAGTPLDLALEGRVENHGLILADGNVSLLATSVLNAGDIRALGGNVLLVGGERVELGGFDQLASGWDGRKDLAADLAGGDVTNAGRIASADAVMLGGRTVNLGEIEIEDGSLLMVGADAVYLSRFDNPVLIRLPRGAVGAATGGDAGDPARYAVENHGRIDAGRGHVRLAAADPLGFGIRQGTGSAAAPAGIAAGRIELEGGENGRVQLSGVLDAGDDGKRGRGGEIDVTGDLIVLADATVDASGTRGGGTIQIGGEQQGQGELQRARAVLVDEKSEIRADALRNGDGGRVVVFSEDLTSIEGAISARGGHRGGDGGFVETSGLRHFEIADLPDVGARRGVAGSWLIDPYDITITNDAVDCDDPTVACLDPAIDAILDPEFDNAGFDGILRTLDSDPNDGIAPTNYVSADLIERALGIGTNVTLSTQSFDDAEGNAPGNITIEDAISIDSSSILEGRIARLTLLAAGHIFVNANIEVVPTNLGTRSERSNLALTVELVANDPSQIEAGSDFDLDRLDGNVELNADIRTGGGRFIATGISVLQQAGRQIVTRGGDVTIRSGTIARDRLPITEEREKDDPALVDGAIDTRLELLGDIDTRTADGRRDGGDVALVASSVNVGVRQSGDDPLSIVTGLLSIVGDVLTGGGDINLAGGVATTEDDQRFAGNVEVEGTLDTRRGDIEGNLDQNGGNVTIRANRVNEAGDNGDFDVTHVEAATDPTRGEGGEISIDGTIRTAGGVVALGNDTARSILIDGTVDTTQTNTRENGLVQIIARDQTGIDDGDGDSDETFGAGEIQIGSRSATSISTAGLTLRTRDLTTSDGSGANAVDIELEGRTTSRFFAVVSEIEEQTGDEPEVDEPQIGLLDLEALRSAAFGENTSLTAETIRMTVAADPLAITDLERANGQDRLVFGGANGAGASASDGVRLNADEIVLAIGDGPTATDDLFSDDLGSLASPTDLGVQRQTRGDFRGLQLRDQSGALRPAEIRLRQDGDLTITQGAAAAAGQLDLAGAFGSAQIGDDGMRLGLESSDGVLTVEDAAGFNDNAGPLGPGDEGKSFVRLLGGLLLPDSPGGTNPDPETVPTPNSVVFRDGTAVLGDDGTTAFSVESLEISTPGDFSITQQIAAGIDAVAELIFEAGRETGNEDAAGRGTLTIAAATALTASERLVLGAGDSGYGDLVFAGAGTTLSADEIELRAGSEGDSRNTDAADRSRIVGLQAQDVTLRDAAGGIFGAAGSSALAFRYRQAAGIDAAVDLPALSQFGFGVGESFRAAGDVEYAVRSDEGQIDLDDGILGTNEADRFRNASLSLIGLQSGSAAAILVSADTAFVGKRVELGGVGGFSFDAALARVFNRSGTDADERLTLRAGVGGSGDLLFAGGVLVKAPTIRLAVGDGTDGDAGSNIDTKNATFDLSGPLGADRTFAYQIDDRFDVSDLPDATQFVGGAAGLPSVLAIRNDAGQIEIEDFDAAELPLALASGPSRLVLEAEQITLSQTDGDDLELTTNPNLFLRLRANVLSLLAFVSNDRDTESGRVRMGPRAGDSQITAGTDADFDDESLLVEAFDFDDDLQNEYPSDFESDFAFEFVTTGNLSGMSESPAGSGLYDLAAGRGPTNISVRQDGSVQVADLADRRSFSGLLARTRLDANEDDDLDGEDDPIASIYSIQSELGSVTVEPEKVNGSNLILSGNVEVDADAAIDFAPGSGPNPGLYLLDGLLAQTEDSIVVRAGTQLVAQDAIGLIAGQVGLPDDEMTEPFGSIRFEGNHGDGQVTRLEANQITLAAGPDRTLTNPDEDNDGQRDDIDDALLPKLDLSGLDELALAGDPESSLLRLRQNASFDATLGGEGDFLTALAAGADQAGAGGDEWKTLEVVSVQGELRIGEIGLLADEASQLNLRTNLDGNIVVEMPDQADRPAPFDDFADGVRIESNDITFRSTDPGTSIDLATDQLLLVGRAPLFSASGDAIEADLGRLRSDIQAEADEDDDDEDPLFRPIVRIHQAAAFTSSELPRPSQYAIVDSLGETILRSDLRGLDIELRTTAPGTTLTLDDDVRARTTGSNLILRSAGDVAIALSDRTPGYAALPAYAALQLSSLDIEADGGNGTIRFDPFTLDAAAADLSLETFGDQRFAGDVELRNGLVTTGRDLTFEGDVTQSGSPDAGLVVATRGKVRFGGSLGTLADRLDRLWVLFDAEADDDDFDPRTPTVEFGGRTDTDGDGVAETPIDSDQGVFTRGDILFLATALPTQTFVSRLEASLGTVDDLGELDVLLRDDSLEIGRNRNVTSSTVGKALGDLRFDSSEGLFTASGGEKLSVGGTLAIDAANGLAAFSDVSALTLDVTAGEIGLLRRESGINLDLGGQTHRDGGPSISANTIDFGGQTPRVIGRGRSPRFGLPDPFAADDALSFLDRLAVFGIRSGGRALRESDFRFAGSSDDLAETVPFLVPTGASRSDLSGANGPTQVPTSKLESAEPQRLANPERLRALAVEARPTSEEVVLARLGGVAVIDDRGLASDGASAVVSESRLDARDAEAAIALYQRLFGAEGERTEKVRSVLQDALDQYLETHRAQRVVGFELRRFVKNRPSTLIEAYTTLEDLDALFRYHRRLGLSPGEFKRIQRGWLEKIRPDGIEVEELAETVHPSRYVRGSDILDIFGQ
jgi:filamentous hemagglutinin family protein